MMTVAVIIVFFMVWYRLLASLSRVEGQCLCMSEAMILLKNENWKFTRPQRYETESVSVIATALITQKAVTQCSQNIA